MEVIKNGFINKRLGIELDVYVIDGKEWFDVRTLVDLFGFRDLSKLTDKITDPHDKDTQSLCTLGGKQETTVITETGLYEIIFSISKRNLERHKKALEFKRWVFEEVLPNIRKNNFYIDNKHITKEQYNKAVDYLLSLCKYGKISLGRASKDIFGNSSELKNRLVNLGWLDYENCRFVQQYTKASNGESYPLFVCNMSGKYDDGEVKHTLQVSLTNAGFVWLRDKIEKDENFGKQKG